MRRLAACGVGLLVCLALAHDAAAESWQDLLTGPWSAPQSPHPAVARIRVPQRDNAIAFGSGTLVDANEKLGLVITNWHVVDGAAGEIVVAFPDGFRSGGRVLKTDRDWDLAALAIWKPNVQPVPLSTQPPRPGDVLTIAGYGQGRYRAASGRCTQYVAPGLNFPYEMIEVAAAARQGDSGGPILNANGQLAGVLFGEGGGRTSGSYCRRVHQFLATITMPPGLGPLGPANTNPPASALAAAPASGRDQSRPDDQAWISSAPAASSGPAAPAATPVFAAATTGYPVANPPSNPIAPQAPLRPIQMAHESSLNSTPDQADTDSSAAGSTNRFRNPSTSPQAADEPPSVADGDWAQWLRSEPLEQIKAALAVVGAMALVMHGLRWFRSG